MPKKASKNSKKRKSSQPKKKDPIWNPSTAKPKYGYHQSLPVPISCTNKHGKTMGHQYSKLTDSDQYMVICLKCNQNWDQRKPFYSFNKNHQRKKHKDDPKDFNIKIVSWLSLHPFKANAYGQEWRLVNEATLEYIQPSLPYYTDKDSDQSIFPSIYHTSISNNIFDMAGIKICKKFWSPIQLTRYLLEFGYETSNYHINPDECIIPNEINYEPIYNQSLMMYRWMEYNDPTQNSHYPNFKISQSLLSSEAIQDQLALLPPEVNHPIANDASLNAHIDDEDIDMNGEYYDTQTQHKSVHIEPDLSYPVSNDSISESMFHIFSFNIILFHSVFILALPNQPCNNK